MSNKNLKPLHLACLMDENRPNMRLIKIKDGIATATNGYMIVKVNLKETSSLETHQIELLNGKCIHMMVWQAMIDAEHIEIKPDEIITYKDRVKVSYEYTPSVGEFFNTDSILHTAKEEGENPQRLIGINPKYVSTLAKIFGSQDMFFSFVTNSSAIVFSSDEGVCAYLSLLHSESVNRYLFI